MAGEKEQTDVLINIEDGDDVDLNQEEKADVEVPLAEEEVVEKRGWFSSLFKKSEAKVQPIEVLSFVLLEELKMKSMFLENEIKQLYSRFSRMPRIETEDKVIKISEKSMFDIPEFKHNPLKKRISKVLKIPKYLTFDEMLIYLQVFSMNYPKEEKVKFAFDLFDYDGDSLIGRDDVKSFLKEVLEIPLKENELTMEEIDVVADNMFKEISDTVVYSYFTFDEFRKLVMFEDGIFQKFTIDLDTLGFRL
ncbi:calcineurin subunit CNB1 [Acrasis kona]|uniref:Calcineurin subunit CNB1 n=1 Tax=Acrasis kona TaxID=1008807 RepID=A0AAW2Z6B7_9EUKA